MRLLAAALAGTAVGVLLVPPPVGRLRLTDLAGTAGLAGLAGTAPDAERRIRPAVPAAAVVIAVPTALAGLLAGPVAGALVALAGLVALRVRTVRSSAAVAAAERDGALQACRVLSGELAAGRTPADALAAAAEVACGAVRTALRSGATAARLGGEVPAALVGPVGGSAVPGVLQSLAACWAVCAQSGGGLSAAVSRLEEGLRADAAQRRRVDAELAGPRATAALLGVLPGGGLLLAVGVGADPLHVLLETPVGLVCLVTGLALDALGLLWTDRLVRRVRPP